MISQDNIFEEGLIEAFNMRKTNPHRALELIAGTGTSLVQGKYFFSKSKEEIEQDLAKMLFSDDIVQDQNCLQGRSIVAGYDSSFTPDLVFPWIKENFPNAIIFPTGDDRVMFQYNFKTKSFLVDTKKKGSD